MDLCLVGTAEIPLAGYYANKILNKDALPIKMAAFSHCFRQEAGGAGSAVRGLYRVHQFSKVELFVIATPEQSNEIHEELRKIEEVSEWLVVRADEEPVVVTFFFFSVYRCGCRKCLRVLGSTLRLWTCPQRILAVQRIESSILRHGCLRVVRRVLTEKFPPRRTAPITRREDSAYAIENLEEITGMQRGV